MRLDGVDLREVKQASIRRAVALVPQEVALFNDTLLANIAFGDPDASEADVWSAVEAAELAAFVESLPFKLETRVGERGLKLSGGERQRVGLARRCWPVRACWCSTKPPAPSTAPPRRRSRPPCAR
ncbi:MAG: ATP-binding cassette domain-containing protein [Caulobacteraceae bacterium]